jgi:hypothetical protein
MRMRDTGRRSTRCSTSRKRRGCRLRAREWSRTPSIVSAKMPRARRGAAKPRSIFESEQEGVATRMSPIWKRREEGEANGGQTEESVDGIVVSDASLAAHRAGVCALLPLPLRAQSRRVLNAFSVLAVRTQSRRVLNAFHVLAVRPVYYIRFPVPLNFPSSSRCCPCARTASHSAAENLP